MAALLSTDHWSQLLFRGERVAVGAMAQTKNRATHVMADATPRYHRASGIVVWNKNDNSSSWQRQRAQLLKQLKQEDGKHLIVVSYGLAHSVHNEWVYNEADIDRAKVIFARAINSTQDCRLVDYFKSRRIWSLDIDGDQLIPALKPYPRNQCEGIRATTLSASPITSNCHATRVVDCERGAAHHLQLFDPVWL